MIKIVQLANTSKLKLTLWDRSLYVTGSYYFKVVSTANLGNSKILGVRHFELNPNQKFEIKIARDKDDTLCFFWDDEFLGRAVMLFYLSHIFNCPLTSFVAGPLFPSKVFRLIIGWLIEKQNGEIEDIYATFENEEDLKWTLDNLKVSKSLNINFPSYQGQLISYSLNFHPKILKIANSGWFNIDNLVPAAKSCMLISLEQSKLSNKDLDAFLRLWMTGEFPCLQFFAIKSESFNDKEKIMDRSPMQWKTKRRLLRQKQILTNYVEVIRGVGIENEDGVKAEVELIFFPTPRFVLYLL
ncbi:unnamed protein product [Caenorhabditis nigoni]